MFVESKYMRPLGANLGECRKLRRKYVISVDIGASSGKMARIAFDGNKITIDNERDFPNVPVAIHNNLYWNIFSLYNSLLEGCRTFSGVDIASIGVDTWGATFGLINRAGQLAEPVFHYRDLRTKDALGHMHEILSAKEIFRMTGCQPTRNYSLPQLFVMAQRNEDILKTAKAVLFLPDLFSYFLSGSMTSEISFAGTTALLNDRLDGWCKPLLQRFGIPTGLFTDLVPAGSIKDRLTTVVREQTGLGADTKVVAACSHDTAAATCAIPGFGDGSVYVGSGTNINMGMECDFIGLSDAFFYGGFKNTGGMCGKNLIYRDFGAFWFLNGLLEDWGRKGIRYSFEEITRMAEGVSDNQSFLDLDDESFNRADGGMAEKMNAYFDRTGQARPADDAGYLRCIFESIALKTAHTVRTLSKASSKSFREICIINGGSRNALLNQLIADATGLPVRAGLPYASLVGNALSQLYALGEVKSLAEMREVSARSFEMKNFEPYGNRAWAEKMERAWNIGVLGQAR